MLEMCVGMADEVGGMGVRVEDEEGGGRRVERLSRAERVGLGRERSCEMSERRSSRDTAGSDLVDAGIGLDMALMDN